MALFGLPSPCINCGKILLGKRLCEKCYELINSYDFKECMHCRLLAIDGNTHKYCKSKADNVSPDQCIYSFLYQDVVKQIILSAKSKKCEFSLLEILFKLQDFENDMQILANTKFDFIFPIPLNRNKKTARFKNHTEIISQKIANKLNTKCVYDLVTYTDSRNQKHLNRNERLYSPNRFNINYKKIKTVSNKKILIVDDVITSGKTVLDLTRLLREHNASYIGVYALARPIMYNNAINYGNF